MVIMELKDKHRRSFIKRNDLDRICQDFYQDLYRHEDIEEEALIKMMEGVPATFTPAMNEVLVKEVSERELRGAVNSMTKGKALAHDDILVEFYQKMWLTIGKDFHHMIIQSMDEEKLHEGVTKGLTSLIPKEGDAKDFNYWRPITLLTVIYKIFAKTLQIRLQPILRDVISPKQTAFLPLRFILDNIVFTQEILHWAKASR